MNKKKRNKLVEKEKKIPPLCSERVWSMKKEALVIFQLISILLNTH